MENNVQMQLISKEASNDNFNFLGRKTLWDISISSLGNNIIMSNSKSQRHSRWESSFSKTFTPLPVSSIPENMDINIFENLLRKQRLNDISCRLLSNNFEDDDPDLRDPSPEPIYDSKTGKRLNTRLVINREKYLKEKNDIITELIKYDKNYKPPSDYKPPKKVKILYIKSNDKYNFTKYIIGPKGSNQKKLEEQSKCKITIRGKGSNWNSNSSYQKNYRDEQEPLHVHIQADTDEDLLRGEQLILPLLDENSEEYKKMKMAVTINYGYNNNEPACEFCGERGHKSWACPMNIGQFTKVDIKCKYCGDKGHPSCDCPLKPVDEKNEKNEMEKELNQFLQEVDDFNEQKSIPILEPEYKPSDIRKSVLLTGKINPIKNEAKPITNDEKKKPIIPTMTTKIHQNPPQPTVLPNPLNNLYPSSYYQQYLTYPMNSPMISNLLQTKAPIINPNIKQSAPIQYNYVNVINQMPFNHIYYNQNNYYTIPQVKKQNKNILNNYFPSNNLLQNQYQSISYTNSSSNKMPGFTSGKMTSLQTEVKPNKKINNSNNNTNNREDNKVITYEEMLVKSHQEKVNEDVNIKEKNNIIENDDIKVTDA